MSHMQLQCYKSKAALPVASLWSSMADALSLKAEDINVSLCQVNKLFWDSPPECRSDRRTNDSCLIQKSTTQIISVWNIMWWLFPHLRGFGENVWPFIPCLPFFFKVEISTRTLMPLIRPGSVHSGSASWDDSGRAFPDKIACELVSW